MKKIHRKYSIDPVYRWIGVDLDETLAEYNGGFGLLVIGKPIPKMVNRIKKWLEAGEEVKIVTARLGKATLQVCNEREENVVKAIQDWTEEHIGERLEVTCEKDIGMVELWDDRAIQVLPNKGDRVCR